MKINFRKEYIIIFGVSIFLLIMTTGFNFARYIIGIPYILLLPGYLLTAVLFPKADDLNGLTRAVLSVGLSVIIVPLIGLLINYSPFGIQLLSMMLSLMAFNTILMVLGWFRRKKTPEEERFELTLKSNLLEWVKIKSATKVIHVSLIIAVLLIVISLIYISVSPQRDDNFSEFYITGLSGMEEGYPKQLKAGSPGSVKVAIINNEHKKTTYRIEIKVNDDTVQTIRPITLDYLDQWENRVSFKVGKPENAAKVEFLLFRENQDVLPYRQLRLWISIQT